MTGTLEFPGGQVVKNLQLSTAVAQVRSLAQELLHAVGVAVKIQETKNPVSPGSHPHLLPGHSLPLDPGHWDALPTLAF